jgi:hypothetical protein
VAAAKKQPAMMKSHAEQQGKNDFTVHPGSTETSYVS